jgi:DNA-binding MarR family transcriptional regulator
MIANEETQTLSNLGLTISQATIYLSLIKFESATVKALCRVSSIARQDIYQALSDLYELGLVERIVDKPLRFRAIPIKNALEILQQHRTIKNSNIDSREPEHSLSIQNTGISKMSFKSNLFLSCEPLTVMIRVLRRHIQKLTIVLDCWVVDSNCLFFIAS